METTYRNRYSILDAYLLWIPPFGILGFHHFYLKRYTHFVVYFFTLGLLGIGWLVDFCRMKCLVDQANKKAVEGPRMPPKVQLCDAYLYAVSPFGIFGAHHFYLGRIGWGFLYFFTLGYCGLGWIIDWFRVPKLVERRNKELSGEMNKLYLDDAYVLWCPLFGILGAHHFYMRRFSWGVFYFFTLGIFGIGWLIDLCRLPSLVKKQNAQLHGVLIVAGNNQNNYGGTNIPPAFPPGYNPNRALPGYEYPRQYFIPASTNIMPPPQAAAQGYPVPQYQAAAPGYPVPQYQGAAPGYSGLQSQGAVPDYPDAKTQAGAPDYSGPQSQGAAPGYPGVQPQGAAPSYSGPQSQGVVPDYPGAKTQAGAPGYSGPQSQGAALGYSGPQSQGAAPSYPGPQPQVGGIDHLNPQPPAYEEVCENKQIPG